MLVDNLDAQVEEGFVTHMKKFSNTTVRPLLKNSTKYSQPADRHYMVRVKKDVKRDFRNLLETQSEKYEKGEEVHKITVGELRILVTKWLAKSWERLVSDKQAMIDTFEKTGLSLPIDGSRDHKMKFDDVDKLVME